MLRIRPMSDLRAALASGLIDLSSFRIRDGAVPLGLLTTPGDRAIPLWRELRAVVGATGHWPVVLGPDDALEAVERQMGDQEAAPTETRELDLDQIRKARLRQIAEERSEMPLPLRIFFGVERGAREILARVGPAAGASNEDYSIPFDVLTSRPHASVRLGLVPVVSQWAVPEPVPCSRSHAVILRDWSDRFSAEIVGLSHDTLDLRVATFMAVPGVLRVRQRTYPP
jgi:hypothetical protein